MEQRRILIVEDHASLRRILEVALNTQKDLACCGSVSSGEEAFEVVAEKRPDLVLADLSLPGISGIELVQYLKEASPGLACAIYSGHDEATYASQAIEAGARGYIVKGDPMDLILGLRRIIAGEVYVSKRVAGVRG